MLREHTRMYGSNKFKLGLFGMNCSNGMTMTKAPERWDHSWRNNVIAAKLADELEAAFDLFSKIAAKLHKPSQLPV